MTDGKFPWEGQEPVKNVFGFCAAAGNVKIYLGFAVYQAGQVLVYAMESMGGASATPWRRAWTGPDNAVDVANDICCDVADYLEQFQLQRPAEDLDMDDFLECIRLYTTGGLH